jgi:hypothetical protein
MSLEDAQRRFTLPDFALATRALVLVAILLSLALVAAPYLRDGFVMGHDGGVHQTYAFQFDRALRQGQFPVRWVEGIDPGTGQPLFSFYQVGFYYLVSTIHAVGPPLGAAFKLAVVGQWALGAAFIYLLCLPMGRVAAAVGSVMFVWTPYLLLDVYVRTAYPEFAAIGFAVGVLWAADRCLRIGGQRYQLSLSALTALTLVTHPPTALIVGSMAAALVIVAAVTRQARPSAVARTCAAPLLGSGLASFYLIPALLQQGQVKMAQLTSGYFDYHLHFVEPRWWFDWSWRYGESGVNASNQLSVQIGIAQWTVLGLSVLLLVVPAWRRRAQLGPGQVVGWLLIVAAAMFMMTAASTVVWDAIGPMHFIQFPWRLLMAPAIACAVLAAAVTSALNARPGWQLAVLAVAVAALWRLDAAYLTQAFQQPRDHIDISWHEWNSTPEARRTAVRVRAYDPAAAAEEPQPRPERWSISGGGSMSVEALRQEDADLLLEVDAPSAATLIINTPAYPGWEVTVGDRKASPGIDPDTGYMVVPIPRGRHLVRAHFTRDRVRAVADAIALASAALWSGQFGMALWRRRKASTAGQEHPAVDRQIR